MVQFKNGIEKIILSNYYIIRN